MRRSKRGSNGIKTDRAASDPDSISIFFMQFFQMRFNLWKRQISMPGEGDIYLGIHNKSLRLSLFKLYPDCCLISEERHKKEKDNIGSKE
jgi:hypothetical protein